MALVEIDKLVISATKILVGANIGIPTASLCINRRLYLIASVRTVTTSRAEKRRQILVDLAIGLGMPILFMILRKYLPSPSLVQRWLSCIQNTFPKDIGSTSLKTLGA